MSAPQANPFAHQPTGEQDNAVTDHSFDTDKGVPDRHVTTFRNALDASNSSLGEEDYRYPYARTGGNQQALQAQAQAPTDGAWKQPGEPLPGYYPKGYAP